jgi:hypothetical protein
MGVGPSSGGSHVDGTVPLQTIERAHQRSGTKFRYVVYGPSFLCARRC